MESITKLMATIERLVPEYLANPDDRNISGGNWAFYIFKS